MFFNKSIMGKKFHPFFLMNTAVVFILALSFFFPLHAFADEDVLRKSIIDWNLRRHKKSMADGTYRGEEGILMLSPEAGNSFGIKAVLNKDYLDAIELFKEAESHFKAAIEAMSTQKREKLQGEHSINVVQEALQYNKVLLAAHEKIMNYHSKLTPELDERLNNAVCLKLLDKMLEESLDAAGFNLRDALALFYNRCKGLELDSEFLNTENISFINYVFNEVTGNASGNYLNRFDLDLMYNNGKISDSRLRFAEKILGSKHFTFLKSALEAHRDSEYSIDPLLFIALMKKESWFNPFAVSGVGAVGLTQIMPDTAKNLGMKNIFLSSSFRQARSFLKREKELRNMALNLIPRIKEENSNEYGKKAREFMQKSIETGHKRVKMFSKYRQELLIDGTDDRLNPQKAIEHGFRYFLKMIQIQKGDISLALASYNAGPHSVNRYKGIPPYSETVSFRNIVLRYYKDYLRDLNK